MPDRWVPNSAPPVSVTLLKYSVCDRSLRLNRKRVLDVEVNLNVLNAYMTLKRRWTFPFFPSISVGVTRHESDTSIILPAQSCGDQPVIDDRIAAKESLFRPNRVQPQPR